MTTVASETADTARDAALHLPRDRMLMLVVAAMSLVAAGYPTYLSHPITILVPAPLLLALLLVGDARLVAPAWIAGTAVLAIWTALLYLAMASSFRGLVYALAMTAPFAALAWRIGRPEQVALTVAVATTALTSVRVIASWTRAGAEWMPWQVSEGNALAPRLTVLLPLVLVVFLTVSVERRLIRAGLVILMIGGLAGITMSLQRAALAVSVVLLFIGLARTMWKGLVVVAGAAIAGWLVASQSIVHVLERARFVNFVNSHATRPEIWEVALDAVRESAWLGVGPGNSDHALRAVGGGHAHNGLLQSALEAGWVGALCFTGLCLYVLGLAARLVRQGGSDTLWALPLLGYLGLSVMSAPLQRPDFTMILVLVIMAARERVERRGARWAEWR